MGTEEPCRVSNHLYSRVSNTQQPQEVCKCYVDYKLAEWNWCSTFVLQLIRVSPREGKAQWEITFMPAVKGTPKFSSCWSALRCIWSCWWHLSSKNQNLSSRIYKGYKCADPFLRDPKQICLEDPAVSSLVLAAGLWPNLRWVMQDNPSREWDLKQMHWLHWLRTSPAIQSP